MSTSPTPAWPSRRLPRAIHNSTLALLVSSLLALAGCSVNVQLTPAPTPSSAPALPKDQLAGKLADGIAQKTGIRPDGVNCPSDLPQADGVPVTCEVLKAGRQIGTITVARDGGDRVKSNYDIDLSELHSATSGPGK